MGSCSKSFWSYLKTAIIIVMVIMVGILVIIALYFRATPKDIAYFVGVGIFLGLIGYIAKIKSK